LDDRALRGPVIAHLAEQPNKQFADVDAWQAHLEQLGITWDYLDSRLDIV